MSRIVAGIVDKIPVACQTRRCNKRGCRVDLAEAPSPRVIVDMDCEILPVSGNGKRCDYLFVGGECNETWVAPIELKGGRLNASEVLGQLEGGARIADSWLPKGTSFQFAPILAHGKKIHRNDLKVLRSRKIQLRGQKKGTTLIKCGGKLIQGLLP